MERNGLMCLDLSSLEGQDVGIPSSLLMKRAVALLCAIFISGCRRTLRRGETVRDERRVSFKQDDDIMTFTLM